MARRILLVDDDIAAIATVKRALSREGLQVLLATAAADGVVALAHHDPEVVLLAPAVDGGRGADVRRAISRDRRRDRMLVLLLGDGSDPVFDGDAVFEKPIDPLAVLAAIRSQFPGEVGQELPSWTMDEPGDSAPDLALDEPGSQGPASGDADAPDLFDGGPWSLPPSPLRRTEQARAEAQERIRRIAQEARVAVETRRVNEKTAPPDAQARSVLARETADPDATGEMEVPPGLRAALARTDELPGLLERTMVEAPRPPGRAPEPGGPPPRPDTPRPASSPGPAAASAELEAVRAEAASLREQVLDARGEAASLRDALDELRARQAAGDASTVEELERSRAEAAGARREADRARAQAATAETERARLAADLSAIGDRAAKLQAQVDGERAEAARARERDRTELGRRTEETITRAGEEAAARAAVAIAAAREEAEAQARQAIEEERASARSEAVEAIAKAREEAEARVREAEENARTDAGATVARAHKELEARAREAVESARTALQEKTRKALADAATAAEDRFHQARAEAAAELERVRAELEARGRKAVEEARTQGHRAVEEIRTAGEAQLRRAVDEARRSLERTRAAGDEALAQARSEAEEERARLESDLALARGVADELHARGEEVRRKLLATEAALEEEQRRRAADAEAAAAALRRSEADAGRKLQEETARVAAVTRREVEEELRREAQREAEVRADTRRRAALEARRTPVPGLDPPSALLETYRLRAADGDELPLPASMPAAMAESLPGPGEPLPPEGSFADAGRLLARLGKDSFTGRLDLEIPGGRRTLYLEGGRVVGAQSEAPGEGIEDLALREGLITREQKNWARTAPAAGARQLAALLSERGHVKASELVPLVRGRVAEIAFAAFERDGGRYALALEQVDPEERVALPETTMALVTEGIRRKYVAERLHAKLGGPGTLLRPAEGASIDELGLTSREKRVVALADGLRTLDELLLDAGVDETFALRALWAGVVGGVLEVAVRGLPTMEEGGVLDRLRIAEKHRQARESDYFELLGLPRTCTAYEVDEAYERLVHEFSPERHAGLGDASLQKLLKEIQAVLGDARDVLRDDRLRGDYARNLALAGS